VALGGAEAGSVTKATSHPRIEPDGDWPCPQRCEDAERAGCLRPGPMGADESSQHACHPHVRRRQAEQGGSSSIAGAMWQRINERIEALW